MITLHDKSKKKGELKKRILAVLLFFLFFPYLFSSFKKEPKEALLETEEAGKIWVRQEEFWGSRRVSLEDYLVGMMAATISPESEAETLKAQAILLRSFCICYLEKRDGIRLIPEEKIKEYYFSEGQREHLWGEERESKEEKMRQAAEATRGMILLWKEEVAAPPFFYLSSGKTRDIKEHLIRTENYDYLKTVECPEDIRAEEYIEYREISKKEFQKILFSFLKKEDINSGKIVLYRDGADYVKTVEVDGKEIDGEAFRHALNLPSACFYLEAAGAKIQIQIKGKGHGFGFPQYSANELAKQGVTYEELLSYFFEGLTLQRI